MSINVNAIAAIIARYPETESETGIQRVAVAIEKNIPEIDTVNTE